MAKSAKKRGPLTVSQERLHSKFEECEFFLNQMRQSREPREFAFHLSAFLTAFSSFTVLSLLRNHSKGYKQQLLRLRQSSAVVHRLLEYRDVEVHREGIRIWGYGSHLRAVPRFRGGVWGDLLETSRRSTRFESRFPSRYGSGMLRALERIRPAPDVTRRSFIFEGSGLDVLELCTSGLESVRSLL